MADLFQEHNFRSLIYRWKFQFRKLGCDKIHPLNPLHDGIVPLLQWATAIQNFTSEKLRCSWIALWRKVLRSQNQIMIQPHPPTDDATKCRIEFNSGFIPE